MSETKMLLIAFGSMIVATGLVGGGLYFAGAGPIAVVIGSTLAGVVTYAAICLYSLPHIAKPVYEYIEESDDIRSFEDHER